MQDGERDAMDELDPRGLILESYRMEGIGPAECRSIFLDWVLGLPDGLDPRAAAGALLARFGDLHPAHPMTEVLRRAIERYDAAPARRGGRRARRGA